MERAAQQVEVGCVAFRDREEAAALLASRLSGYRGRKPLILAIPRGAAPMARILADSLAGEMDVVLVQGLCAPGDPKHSIGSIDKTGQVSLEQEIHDVHGLAYHLHHESTMQLGALRRRRAQYTPARPPIDPWGRVVIVVSDDLATESTMIAALRSVRAREPTRLIAASAVAPIELARSLQEEADEVICLTQPKELDEIGQFFADFRRISDEDVIAALKRGAPEAHSGSRA